MTEHLILWPDSESFDNHKNSDITLPTIRNIKILKIDFQNFTFTHEKTKAYALGLYAESLVRFVCFLSDRRSVKSIQSQLLYYRKTTVPLAPNLWKTNFQNIDIAQESTLYMW